MDECVVMTLGTDARMTLGSPIPYTAHHKTPIKAEGETKLGTFLFLVPWGSSLPGMAHANPRGRAAGRPTRHKDRTKGSHQLGRFHNRAEQFMGGCW